MLYYHRHISFLFTESLPLLTILSAVVGGVVAIIGFTTAIVLCHRNNQNKSVFDDGKSTACHMFTHIIALITTNTPDYATTGGSRNNGSSATKSQTVTGSMSTADTSSDKHYVNRTKLGYNDTSWETGSRVLDLENDTWPYDGQTVTANTQLHQVSINNKQRSYTEKSELLLCLKYFQDMTHLGNYHEIPTSEQPLMYQPQSIAMTNRGGPIPTDPRYSAIYANPYLSRPYVGNGHTNGTVLMTNPTDAPDLIRRAPPIYNDRDYITMSGVANGNRYGGFRGTAI
jgi:hypothetical protein